MVLLQALSEKAVEGLVHITPEKFENVTISSHLDLTRGQ